MNIESRKLNFIQEFLKIQNEEIVIILEKLLHKQKAELLDQEIKPMSIEQLNSDIDQSFEDARNGRIIEAKNLKSIIQKWN